MAGRSGAGTRMLARRSRRGVRWWSSVPSSDRGVGACKKRGQIACLEAIEGADRLGELVRERWLDTSRREPRELLARTLPAHRTCHEALVVGLLGGERRTAREEDGKPAGVLALEARG